MALPDGLLLDCGVTDNPCGLLDIKCPAYREKISLVDLCTKPEYKPSTFFLWYANVKFHLMTTHKYYYQMHAQFYIIGRPWCNLVIWTPFLYIRRTYICSLTPLWGVRRYTHNWENSTWTHSFPSWWVLIIQVANWFQNLFHFWVSILLTYQNQRSMIKYDHIPFLVAYYTRWFCMEIVVECLACNEKIGPAGPILAAKTGPPLPISVPLQKM